MRPDTGRPDLGIVFAVCAFLALIAPAAKAGGLTEYRLQPGDVIEVSIAGLPELTQRLPVQFDGTVVHSLTGQVEVGGQTLSEMQGQIQSTIASRLLPVGASAPRTVDRDQIAAVLVDYRPIWVDGYVNRPGRTDFRPLMTVRHAIADAGGIYRDPVIEDGAEGIRSAFMKAWIRAAGQSARVWRLKTELGQDADWKFENLPGNPVPRERLKGIMARERAIIEARRKELESERDFLQESVDFGLTEIELLKKQLEIAEHSEKEDQAEYERMQELLERGRLTNNRVVDARRIALFSSTRSLELKNQLVRLERQRQKDAYALQTLESRWRAELLSELQRTEIELGESMAQAEGMGAQILGLLGGGDMSERKEVAIMLVRRNSDGVQRIRNPTLDEFLFPGDVIEIGFEGFSPAQAPLASVK